DNRAAYERIKLRPKVFVDVSIHSTNDLSCKTTILNSTTISFPCIIAPTALHRLANQDGELATVRAAVRSNTIMIVSTMASTRMELIAEEHQKTMMEYKTSSSALWYQLYVLENREYTKNLIQRAEKCGYKALVITVDACVIGNRECDHHNNFQLPNGISYGNFLSDENNKSCAEKDVPTYYTHPFDTSLSWNDLEWFRSVTKLPLIIKGIIHPDDAVLAVKANVAGIIVSNHGGRQLDTCMSTIDALADIMQAVRPLNTNMEIYMDGGIRRGTDILKAISLGAKAVCIGRPVLWGLSADGEKGVKHVLDILKKEFKLAMMLCGCQTVNELDKSLLHTTTLTSKL
ncbi:unnamed protein product, partial [Didymodactylos carnosus]